MKTIRQIQESAWAVKEKDGSHTVHRTQKEARKHARRHGGELDMEKTVSMMSPGQQERRKKLADFVTNFKKKWYD